MLTNEECAEARNSEQYRPTGDKRTLINGYFDVVFGNIIFSEEALEKIKSKDNLAIPNIFFSVEKPKILIMISLIWD